MTDLDRNLHIHTNQSSCGRPEMTMINVLDECAHLGFKAVGISDHFHETSRDLWGMMETNRKLIEEYRQGYPNNGDQNCFMWDDLVDLFGLAKEDLYMPHQHS